MQEQFHLCNCSSNEGPKRGIKDDERLAQSPIRNSSEALRAARFSFRHCTAIGDLWSLAFKSKASESQIRTEAGCPNTARALVYRRRRRACQIAGLLWRATGGSDAGVLSVPDVVQS